MSKQIKNKISKRILDLFVSFVGIVVLSPIILLVSIGLRVTSKGRILFKQKRVGTNGELFEMAKFRTMTDVSEPIFPPSHEQKITNFGGFLRKTKLDELPQLFNVFSGKMSFVGPRPELPEFVEIFDTEFIEIFSEVKPGIVDLASIFLRDEEAFLYTSGNPKECYVQKILPSKIKFIHIYIQKQNILIDIVLIFLLFLVVILPKPAQFIAEKLAGSSHIWSI